MRRVKKRNAYVKSSLDASNTIKSKSRDTISRRFSYLRSVVIHTPIPQMAE